MKQLFAVISLAILFVSCSDTKKGSDGFQINGEVADIESGTVILMKQESRTQMVGLDTAEIEAGKFVLEGKLDFPQPLLISIEGMESPIMVFVENSKIDIKINKDNISSPEISGSKSHDDYVVFTDMVTPYEEKLNELYPQFQKASQENNEAEIKRLDSIYEAIDNEKSSKIKEFIKNNPKSFISPYAARKYLVYYLDGKELDGFVSNFDSSLAKSKHYQFLAERVDVLKKVAVGQQAPNFTVNDSAGTPVSLADFKGKYVLVDFWASWCSPCRAENPNVVAMYNKYNEKGFEVFSVSFDSKRENWLKAIEEDNLTWTHASELNGWENEAGKLYGVMSIPHTVLIDKEGKIIAKGEETRGEKLELKLAEIFK